MIRLDIQPYCDACCDFEPSVTKPVRETLYPVDTCDNKPIVVQSDTIVRCAHAKRCETIKRYLERQEDNKNG